MNKHVAGDRRGPARGHPWTGGAIDVTKGPGKVCVRLPHPSVPGRRSTKVSDVASTTKAIVESADELAEMGIERVVLGATSDCWRPFLYLLEARGLCAGWSTPTTPSRCRAGRRPTSWTPCGKADGD